MSKYQIIIVSTLVFLLDISFAVSAFHSHSYILGTLDSLLALALLVICIYNRKNILARK